MGILSPLFSNLGLRFPKITQVIFNKQENLNMQIPELP